MSAMDIDTDSIAAAFASFSSPTSTPAKYASPGASGQPTLTCDTPQHTRKQQHDAPKDVKPVDASKYTELFGASPPNDAVVPKTERNSSCGFDEFFGGNASILSPASCVETPLPGKQGAAAPELFGSSGVASEALAARFSAASAPHLSASPIAQERESSSRQPTRTKSSEEVQKQEALKKEVWSKMTADELARFKALSPEQQRDKFKALYKAHVQDKAEKAERQQQLEQAKAAAEKQSLRLNFSNISRTKSSEEVQKQEALKKEVWSKMTADELARFKALSPEQQRDTFKALYKAHVQEEAAKGEREEEKAKTAAEKQSLRLNFSNISRTKSSEEVQKQEALKKEVWSKMTADELARFKALSPEQQRDKFKALYKAHVQEEAAKGESEREQVQEKAMSADKSSGDNESLKFFEWSKEDKDKLKSEIFHRMMPHQLKKFRAMTPKNQKACFETLARVHLQQKAEREELKRREQLQQKRRAGSISGSSSGGIAGPHSKHAGLKPLSDVSYHPMIYKQPKVQYTGQDPFLCMKLPIGALPPSPLEVTGMGVDARESEELVDLPSKEEVIQLMNASQRKKFMAMPPETQNKCYETLAKEYLRKKKEGLIPGTPSVQTSEASAQKPPRVPTAAAVTQPKASVNAENPFAFFNTATAAASKASPIMRTKSSEEVQKQEALKKEVWSKMTADELARFKALSPEQQRDKFKALYKAHVQDKAEKAERQEEGAEAVRKREAEEAKRKGKEDLRKPEVKKLDFKKLEDENARQSRFEEEEEATSSVTIRSRATKKTPEVILGQVVWVEQTEEPPADVAEASASPGPSAEATHSSRPGMVRQMDGAFAGLLHVTVHKINTAAFMDRTDSYVSLQLGSDEQKTSCKNNAGGKNVMFDETLTFLNKALMESTLQVGVYHKNMTGNDSLMGQFDVNLNLQSLQEEAESEAPVAFECMHKGKPAGQVLLSFSRKAVPAALRSTRKSTMNTAMKSPTSPGGEEASAFSIQASFKKDPTTAAPSASSAAKSLSGGTAGDLKQEVWSKMSSEQQAKFKAMSTDQQTQLFKTLTKVHLESLEKAERLEKEEEAKRKAEVFSFESLDTDGDGRISLREYIAGFDKLDKNHDGYIDREEFEEAKHKMEAKNRREPAPAAPATPATPATPAAKPEASPASKSADQQERGKKEIWSSLSVPQNLEQNQIESQSERSAMQSASASIKASGATSPPPSRGQPPEEQPKMTVEMWQGFTPEQRVAYQQQQQQQQVEAMKKEVWAKMSGEQQAKFRGMTAEQQKQTFEALMKTHLQQKREQVASMPTTPAGSVPTTPVLSAAKPPMTPQAWQQMTPQQRAAYQQQQVESLKKEVWAKMTGEQQTKFRGMTAEQQKQTFEALMKTHLQHRQEQVASMPTTPAGSVPTTPVLSAAKPPMTPQVLQQTTPQQRPAYQQQQVEAMKKEVWAKMTGEQQAKFRGMTAEQQKHTFEALMKVHLQEQEQQHSPRRQQQGIVGMSHKEQAPEPQHKGREEEDRKKRDEQNLASTLAQKRDQQREEEAKGVAASDAERVRASKTHVGAAEMHHSSPETAAIYQMAKHAEEEAAAARKKIEEALQAQAFFSTEVKRLGAENIMLKEKVEQLNLSEKSLEEKVKHLNESLSRSGSPNSSTSMLVFSPQKSEMNKTSSLPDKPDQLNKTTEETKGREVGKPAVSKSQSEQDAEQQRMQDDTKKEVWQRMTPAQQKKFQQMSQAQQKQMFEALVKVHLQEKKRLESSAGSSGGRDVDDDLR